MSEKKHIKNRARMEADLALPPGLRQWIANVNDNISWSSSSDSSESDSSSSTSVSSSSTSVEA